MTRRRKVCLTIVVASALQLGTSAVAAQIPVIVHGRVEDGVTRAPLSQARVWSAGDTTRSVLTDSTGAFSIEVANGRAISLLVEGFGYVADRFDLTAEAATRVTVLLLEPEPVELAGVDVEAEAVVAAVLTQLENRRNIYPYSVQSYDARTFADASAYGNVWDFLRARVPKIHECSNSRTGLCVGDPVMAFDPQGPGDRAPPHETPPLLVCIDGVLSTLAIQELRTLGIHRVALLEIYRFGRGGVRVYTADYVNFSARNGGVYVDPVHTWDFPTRC